MTLAEHAEAWQRERCALVPKRGTQAWNVMYQEWIAFAFEDFAEEETSK